MNNHRLKRQLRKEILILKAQACRTEIRQEAVALAAVLSPPAHQGSSWTDSLLWTLLSSGEGRLARWMRWGKTVTRLWPVLKSVLESLRRSPHGDAPAPD